MYTELKYAHMFFVTISILLFGYRFFLKIFNRKIGKALKIVPHINDSLLLASGISLAYWAGFNPLQQYWLGTKIIALFLYIGFGMLALKSNGAKSVFGFVLATATFIFIVYTATTKTSLFIGF